MKKLMVFILIVLALALAAWGGEREAKPASRTAVSSGGSFALGVDCRYPGVRRLEYSYYAGEERRGCGGTMALDEDLRDDLTLTFGPSQFREEGNLGNFSIAFSLYGSDGETRLGTTNRLAFPVRYGEGYSVCLSGDEAGGFSARLVE